MQDDAEVVEHERDVGMLGAEEFAAQGEAFATELFGLRVAELHVENVGEFAQSGGYVRGVHPGELAADGQ